MNTFGPKTLFSQQLHASKYRGEREDFRECVNRIAATLQDKDDSEHFQALREILGEMRFLPAGRIQSAIGSTRRVTPYNCFVSGTIEDSLREGSGSILSRFNEAMGTMQMGGGIGYDFSTLRPRGDTIKKLGSKSSGPISFMEIFDAGCQTIASAGHRRGAQMGVLRVDHPDIEEFIHAKQNSNRLTGFNISIGVTDKFMQAICDGTTFDLVFNGQTYKTIDARALWETIMRSTWDWAEPGVLFIDRINDQNNLRYCETIAATNPCAEQPLPPHGACLLGSFNLVKYLYKKPDGFYSFDLELFQTDIPTIVRAMDNVVDAAIYPLYEQEKEAKAKRRMGLGVTGLANTLEACGHPYGSEGFVHEMEVILETLANEAYRASAQIARRKGPFPLYNQARYMASPFIGTLEHATREAIKSFGVRNSHLLSIAPTGTISLCADNVSSGIEPVFCYEQKRTVKTFDGDVEVDLVDYGVQFLGVEGKVTEDVTIEEHLAVLTTAYQYVDSAVSKTCNVPGGTKWEDFKRIYMDAWQAGCKGCTTFNKEGERMGILKEKTGSKACRIDPTTGIKTCDE